VPSLDGLALLSKTGASPLLLACIKGHTAMVEWLLEKRADPNAGYLLFNASTSKRALIKDDSAIHYSRLGRPGEGEMLAGGSSALYLACKGGFEAIVELLLHARALTDGPGAARLNGTTPLHVAASLGHLGCVRHLLEASASLDAVSEGTMQESVMPTTMVMKQVPKGAGIQPLFAACAAAADWPEVVQTLLEANADVEAVSQGTGHTPLMGGAMQANIGAMRQLLRAGASLTETNDFGLTARELAVRSHNEAAVLLFDEAKIMIREVGSAAHVAHTIDLEDEDTGTVRQKNKAALARADLSSRVKEELRRLDDKGKK